MAKNLNNLWVSYIDRTYQQIKARVLTTLQAKVPEMTDHTDTNPFVKLLNIFSGLVEMMGYYIDNWGRESYITTCRLYASAISLANSYDYRVKSYTAASADITFRINKVHTLDITIPQGTEVENAEHTKFYTVAPATIISGQTEVTVAAIQKTTTTNVALGVSTGLPDQIFKIDDKVVNNSVVAKVEGINWTLQDTLGYSSIDNTHYIMSVGYDKIPYIQFGDNAFGKIPDNGAAISVDYDVTTGEDGNAEANTITTIVSAVTLPPTFNIECFNRNKASGGSGVESLEELQRRVPLSIRTLKIASRKQDFIDIAKLAPGILQAAVDYNCSTLVYIYLIPTGGGIASAALRQSVVDWFETRKLVFTNIVARSVGNIDISMTLTIEAYRNYQNTVVRQAVSEAVTNYISWATQTIGVGIKFSDLYQVIENVEGVKSSIVSNIILSPYARRLDHEIALNWQKTVTGAGTDIIKWGITKISGTQYNLFRGTNFEGVFNIGHSHAYPEISFIIQAGAYVPDNRWEFFTYPNGNYGVDGKIDITEFSVIVATDSNLNIQVTGGL